MRWGVDRCSLLCGRRRQLVASVPRGHVRHARGETGALHSARSVRAVPRAWLPACSECQWIVCKAFSWKRRARQVFDERMHWRRTCARPVQAAQRGRQLRGARLLLRRPQCKPLQKAHGHRNLHAQRLHYRRKRKREMQKTRRTGDVFFCWVRDGGTGARPVHQAWRERGVFVRWVPQVCVGAWPVHKARWERCVLNGGVQYRRRRSKFVYKTRRQAARLFYTRMHHDGAGQAALLQTRRDRDVLDRWVRRPGASARPLLHPRREGEDVAQFGMIRVFS